MSTPRHWLFAAVPFTAAFFSLAVLGQSLWIPAKAELAQWLIERSWQAALDGNTGMPPWPWADTQAVALLEVPEQGIRQVVLAGNTGRNLAFGPVILEATANGRDWIISGHRDTHFRFLERLKKGDRLSIHTPLTTQWFEVRTVDIVDSRHEELVIEPGLERISLVTCYPFNSPDAGGPWRYVVTALPLKDSASPRPLSSG
jgi:sortase A